MATGSGPGTLLLYLLLRAAGTLRRKDNLLHHLAHDAVGENHGRRAVLEREVKAKRHKVGHLLHAGRSQHYQVVVAVAAALRGLEIIGLRGLDGAETGAAAHHIYYKGGQLGCGDIAYAFLHQADART